MRADDARCPFCVLDSRARGFATAVTLGATLGACSARELGTSMQSDTSASTPSPVDTGDAASSAGSTNATTPSTTIMSETGPVDTTAESSSNDDDYGDPCVFYGGCPGDIGSSLECDLWAQDCPRGEKCMPWANDGGGSWNATRCSPLDPDPAQVGEPCTVEGSGTSGIDNCALGAMCWDVDTETDEGICVDFCTGSAANPTCEDPEASCAITNGEVLILCLPTCDPLVQDCQADDGCSLFTNGVFVCAPGVDEPSAYGEACEYLNACEPGLHCVDPGYVFECPGSWCCTEFCDLEAADPDTACSGAVNGETCIALFDDGQHPNVGICRLPD